MIEQWKAHPFCPGYEISNCGNARSKRKQLKPIRSGNGYLFVNMPDAAGKWRPRYLHHLVWEAFVGSRKGVVVRHLNDDRLDNRLANLAGGKDLDNYVDSFINGKRLLAVPFAAVADIKAKREAGASLRKLAAEYGVAHATIRRITMPSSYSDARLVAHFHRRDN